MLMQKFPNILFLGNGLLRLQGEDSWEDLINTLSRGKYKDEPFDTLPLNFRIVAKTEDNVDVFLKENKQKFYGKPLRDTALKVCEQLLDIGFDEIITTNYGYEIENVCTSLLQGELKKQIINSDILLSIPVAARNVNQSICCTHIIKLITTIRLKKFGIFMVRPKSQTA